MKFFNHKVLAILLLLTQTGIIIKADPLADLMRAGTTDVNTLGKKYLDPVGLGLATATGAGWYNTAKPHKLGGFDITIGANIILPFQNAKSFNFNNADYSTLKLHNGESSAKMPTLVGSMSNAPIIDVELPTMSVPFNTTGLSTTVLNQLSYEDANFSAKIEGSNYVIKNKIGTIANIQLKGIKDFLSNVPITALPSAYAQVGVGLPLGTDLMVRYMPTTSLSDMKIKMYGFGFKHDYKQWIPVLKSLPFESSIVLGYTKMNVEKNVSVTPKSMYSGVIDNSSDSIWKGQKFKVGTSSFACNVIVSKSFLFFTPYVDLGFIIASYNITMTGKYPQLKTASPSEVSPFNEMELKDGTLQLKDESAFANNPNHNLTPNTNFDLTKVYADNTDYKTNPVDFSNSKFMPTIGVGFRIKLLLFSMFAQYQIQPNYNMLSAGLGLTFR
jgi:hypothetical protein